MHFKKEINYYDYTLLYCLSTEIFNFHVPLQYFRTNSLHDMVKMLPTPAIPLDQ